MFSFPFTEDFTLPHRFQVDSTGFHMSIWSPPGLQVDLLWQRALPNYGPKSTWIPGGFQLDSKWTRWTTWTPLHITPKSML